MDYWKHTNTDLLIKLGKKLKFIRLRKDFSQQKLSSETGLSRSTISNMERGKNLTLESLIVYLRQLTELDLLDAFFTENEFPVSPIKYLDLKRKAIKKRSK